LKAYLGIDIGGTFIKMAVVQTAGRILNRGVIDTDPAGGPRKAFRRIFAACESLVGMGRGVDIDGVGVGCAGLVDPSKGYLYSSPNLTEWENSPLKRIAERAFDVYTNVDNDANCAAYGEFRRGSCHGIKDLVFITLGTGVGGGVVVDGRLLRGTGNFAGELGHMTVSADGPKCQCGNRGCLEAYVGTRGIIRSAREKLRTKRSGVLRPWIERDGRQLTPQLVFEAARRRDAAATAVAKEVGERLGVGIASLVNIFNPGAVVVGGGVAGSFDLLLPHIEREVARRAFSHSARIVKIVRSSLGNDATAVGAAMLARDARASDDR
jgi:glucokinase